MPRRVTSRASSRVIRSSKHNRALVRFEIAGHHVDEGRLARAVCSDDADNLARPDLDCHVVRRDNSAEPFLQTTGRDRFMSGPLHIVLG